MRRHPSRSKVRRALHECMSALMLKPPFLPLDQAYQLPYIERSILLKTHVLKAIIVFKWNDIASLAQEVSIMHLLAAFIAVLLFESTSAADCYGSRPSPSPSATKLSDFISPNIDSFCKTVESKKQKHVQKVQAQHYEFRSSVVGFSLPPLPSGGVPGNLTLCEQAFAQIVDQVCTQCDFMYSLTTGSALPRRHFSAALSLPTTKYTI